MQRGGNKLTAPTYLEAFPVPHHMTVGNDLAGGQHYTTALAFWLALGIEGLYDQNGVLHLFEHFAWSQGEGRLREDRQ